jgi:hypothetical protein
MKHLIPFVTLLFLFAGCSDEQAWQTKAWTDPLTDETRTIIFAGGTNGALHLAVRCEFDGINLLLGHKHLGGDANDQVEVQGRVDKNEAFPSARWSVNSNNQSSWAPISIVPKWVNQMKTGVSLLIRVTDPLDDEIVDDTLPLSGFSDAYARFEATCSPE